MDEDLYTNPFFQTLTERYKQLHDVAASNEWVVLVPQVRALYGVALTSRLFSN